jgi:tRNA (guanine26-N2/guanine27-N2)-dimethyltransferase
LESRKANVSRGITEGKARLSIAQGESEVFYNPKMSLNRDLAVLFTASYFPHDKKVRVSDPMTGSGVRTARYMLESGHVMSAVASDKHPAAVEAARRTMELNGLNEQVKVIESEANLLLNQDLEGGFDLVDLDPFGSPAPFFDSALRATVVGGVIAATATDMAPLTGARPAACFRKYGVRVIRTEFEKEMSARVLAGCLATVAMRLELGIEMVFAHASDHYVRIFSSLWKGKKSANRSASLLGYLEYCPKCLNRDLVSSLESVQSICGLCGSRVIIIGPIWIGTLWSGDVAQSMMQRVPTLHSARLSEIQTLLTRISEEANAPAFYYRTDALSRGLRIKPPAIAAVLDSLRRAGYSASRTHFEPNGFRTDANIEDLAALLRSIN